MNRGRINAGTMVPNSGSERVNANVIVTWDDGATLADQEHAIKEAAKLALTRVRDIAAGTGRACQVTS